MKRLPRRTSLVAQTAEVLRESIAVGEWPRWLPGELELARRLHVSRVTLRAALAELERKKLIRGGQGRRREILKPEPEGRGQRARHVVVLLSPEPLHRLPSSAVFWIDALREHLEAAGWPLEVHESAAAYRRRPGQALEELAARLHPAAWVLYRSTPGLQQWFAEHAPMAVVAGSTHPGVALSAVDTDYAAACRHAAGRFLAAGHRRLAVVRPDTELAGDLESVAAFRAGLETEVVVALHHGSVPGICLALERLYQSPRPPTGLLVFHARHALTVLGWLHRQGKPVPGAVSVVVRDDEPFLESVLPAPARYSLPASHFARKISHLVVRLVSGDGPAPRQHRLIPVLVRGESLGPARDLS